MKYVQITRFVISLIKTPLGGSAVGNVSHRPVD